MKTIPIDEAQCRVEQAQALLSVWMEIDTGDKTTWSLICALTTLLDGVPEAVKAAEYEICDYIARDMREGKA